MDIESIKPNPKNPRTINKKQLDLLCKSLQEFPQMMALRPIVVDENGVILGGNMRLQALKANGETEIPDEWVKRSTELTEKQKEEFSIKDNIALGEWELDLLAELDIDSEQLSKWGLDVLLDEGKDVEYTKKVESPTYEPTGDKPHVNELCNGTKALELEKEIEAADIDSEVKKFLVQAAQRHTVFDYQQIAEFYAQSDEQVQALMEASALVIIDFRQAIERGYVQLSQKLGDIYLEDHGEG